MELHIGDKVRVPGIPHAWCVVTEALEGSHVVGIAPYDGYHSPREYADQIGVRWESDLSLEKVPVRCIEQTPLADGEADAMIETLTNYVLEQVWNHGDEIGQEITGQEAAEVLRGIAANLVLNAMHVTP